MFLDAIAAFNQAEYYVCHDLLEEIWHNADPSDRNFYQGILQIAVGLYHLQNLNQNGAAMLLGEGIGRLRRYCPDYQNLNLADLVLESASLLRVVQQVSKENFPLIVQQLETSDLSITSLSVTKPKIKFIG